MDGPTYERQDVGRGRHVLRYEHHEDGHGEESGDAHGHLLAGVGRDIETQERHQRDEDTRQNHIEDVEQRPPLSVTWNKGER